MNKDVNNPSPISKSGLLFRSLLVLTFVLLCLWLVLELAIGIKNFGRDTGWSLENYERYLRANVPNDATDIVFEPDIRRVGGECLALSFRAPAQSASIFTAALCDGVLYEGYDPFDATNTIQPVSGSHLMKMRAFTYYSFSPNAPPTLYGNRCLSQRMAIHQIMVDTSDPDYYAVRFEQPCGACDTTPLPFPCQAIGSNYINPIADFPFMVVGLDSIDSDYVLVHSEICLESQGTYIGWSRFWPSLEGAEIQISVDDSMLPIAIVSEQHRLLPKSDVEAGLDLWDLGYWNYCLIEDWAPGLHTMGIQVTTTEGEEQLYSWEFWVR